MRRRECVGCEEEARWLHGDEPFCELHARTHPQFNDDWTQYSFDSESQFWYTEEEPTLLYDPPSGWMYGFPRFYKPLPGETLEQTLIRDGYPKSQAEFASKHCRFIGSSNGTV